MQTSNDNRTSERYDDEKLIYCVRGKQSTPIKGKMVNCSANGMAFSTFTALDTGERIEISSPEAPLKCAARVIWCEENPARKLTFYRIGVQYQDSEGAIGDG